MEYNDALARIEQIHTRIVATQRYQGFRSTTVTLTGCIAIIGMVISQEWLIRLPPNPWYFVGLWSLVALVSATLCGVDMWHRFQSDASDRRRGTLAFLEQYAPIVPSCAVLTVAMVANGLPTAWLPAIWSYAFGLSILATKRFFNREVSYAGYFYLVAGCVIAAQNYLPAHITMGLTFGIGQVLLAWGLGKGNP